MKVYNNAEIFCPLEGFYIRQALPSQVGLFLQKRYQAIKPKTTKLASSRRPSISKSSSALMITNANWFKSTPKTHGSPLAKYSSRTTEWQSPSTSAGHMKCMAKKAEAFKRLTSSRQVQEQAALLNPSCTTSRTSTRSHFKKSITQLSKFRLYCAHESLKSFQLSTLSCLKTNKSR